MSSVTAMLGLLLCSAPPFFPDQNELAAISFASVATRQTDKDGSGVAGWEGPAKLQLEMARAYLERRDLHLSKVQGFVEVLRETLHSAGMVATTRDQRRVMERLSRLAQAPLEAARENWLGAIELERKRLHIVRKAATTANTLGAQLPGIDLPAVEGLIEQAKASTWRDEAERRIAVYRHVISGYVAFLGGDLLQGMKAMREATRLAPELAKPHEYLGSFYYLAHLPDMAATEWRKALAIEPDNTELRRMLEQRQAATE